MAAGGGPEVIVGATGAGVMVQVNVAVSTIVELVTVTVTVTVCAVVGVPLITPVVELIVSPAGRPVAAYTIGPPVVVAATGRETVSPTVLVCGVIAVIDTVIGTRTATRLTVAPLTFVKLPPMMMLPFASGTMLATPKRTPVPRPLLNAVSRLPSVFRRISESGTSTPLSVMNEPPTRILPSPCTPIEAGLTFGPVPIAASNAVSGVPSALIRPTLESGAPLIVVNAPSMTMRPSACNAHNRDGGESVPQVSIHECYFFNSRVIRAARSIKIAGLVWISSLRFRSIEIRYDPGSAASSRRF